jgi:uncharacterized protein YqhQ
VRGVTLLWDALVLGTRSLMWSADVALSEEEDVQFTGPVAWTTVAVSLAIAIGVFFFLPAAAGKFVEARFGWTPMAAAFFEGVLRLALFLAYLAAIGLMPDIRRVFQYHGAEHKTINAYENGARLVPEEVQRFSVQHPRCGTSFLLGVLVISIFLFAPLNFSSVEGPLGIVLRLGSRLILIPVVAGIAYELLRFSAKHQKNALVKLLIAPGLALQKLTTREPDLNMLECAIAALTPVLAADGVTTSGLGQRISDPAPLEEAAAAA